MTGLANGAIEGARADSAFRQGLAEVFAELADLFGNPRSHGFIYGILFSATEPMSMEQIATQLGISRASVCQGLQVLEELGVVERHADGRTGLYEAKLELKALVSGFIGRRLIPRLEASREKLAGLRDELRSLPPELAREAEWRLARVVQWHNRASKFLPLAETLLSKLNKRIST